MAIHLLLTKRLVYARSDDRLLVTKLHVCVSPVHDHQRDDKCLLIFIAICRRGIILLGLLQSLLLILLFERL